ncbi:Serine/Threonine protein kinase and Signal Transduction Histidine Kinase [Nostoc sphaeroides CCNUC1]|uniref:Serine/Threonine protein kinase and Signal Transduction Histidine Kinase n=1 Tax=Nostoc sphaeroides CCNUC1 TaxID=2653204 RepID=A0A5P8WC17_9NOSO|nr:Serine/Threonine protein kinase and Signal Transduction Histidine Kinase [Nostoc sphaeroides CCNUC1]
MPAAGYAYASVGCIRVGWRRMHKRPDIFCSIPLSTFLGLAIALTEILGRIHAANILSGAFEPTARCFKLPKSSLAQLC